MISDKEIEEILNSYSWVKVEKFDTKGDYDELMKHHIEETTFLINKVREFAKIIKELK